MNPPKIRRGSTGALTSSNVGREGLHRQYGHNVQGADATYVVQGVKTIFALPDGLSFEDGLSAPARYVELEAEMDTLVLISNCPQLNNPCNAYNPTPIRLLVWDA